MNKESFSLKAAAIQGAFIGVASGNIMAAPYIGGGSIFWCVFVFLMLLSSSIVATGNRFVHVGVVAIVSIPLLLLWQAIHNVKANGPLIVTEIAFVILGSQLAAGTLVLVNRIRRK